MRAAKRDFGILVLAIAAMAAGNAVGAEKFFKWVDADGVTHYGEKVPESAKATPVKVTDTTSSDADSEIQRRDARRAELGQARKDQAATATGSSAEGSTDEKARQEKICGQHRANLNTLKNSGRVSIRNPDGTNRYLTDEEMAAQRQRTESEVKRCDEMAAPPTAAAP